MMHRPNLSCHNLELHATSIVILLLLLFVFQTTFALTSISSLLHIADVLNSFVPCWKRQRRFHPIVPISCQSRTTFEIRQHDIFSVSSEDVSENSHQNYGHSSLKFPSLAHADVTTSSLDGLSKIHLSILRRTADRQKFVTGRYPIVVSATRNPTKKWLNLGRRMRKDGSAMAETEILVNGTTSDRSLASIDRSHWIDDDDRLSFGRSFDMFSVEFLAEINIERPGYLQIMNAAYAGSSALLHSKATTSFDARIKSDRLLFPNNVPSLSYDHSPDATVAMRSKLKNGRDRLWVTGFSLASRSGIVMSVDTDTCSINSINDSSAKSMLWPNEVQTVPLNLVVSSPPYNVTSLGIMPKNSSRNLNMSCQYESSQESFHPASKLYQDALLVCDGFLVPTKDRGGLYIVQYPGHHFSERILQLTQKSDRWFYHRAIWIDLTGDGRQSILTSRCQVAPAFGKRRSGDGVVTSGIRKHGQLLWLECPKPTCFDRCGTPIDEDGTVFDPLSERHLPWKAHVLATGPDVMFSVADLDTSDDTIEVISSQFFAKKVGLHSIQKGPKPKVTFSRYIDESCGQAFGSILAALDHDDFQTIKLPFISESVAAREVIDSGSTVKTLVTGDTFSHILVTSHECSLKGENHGASSDPHLEASPLVSPFSEGGSLFAYRVPEGKHAWKTKEWKRSVISSGFKVNGQLKNMINPGAPGFVYTFYAQKDSKARRPLIAVAGDCSESAYVFRPEYEQNIDKKAVSDPSTMYELMVEIECSATVGSIGIGYDCVGSIEQEDGYAKLFIPCYEQDKILVFSLGTS